MQITISQFSNSVGSIDAQNGFIAGVSVISMGEASGHDMIVDETTLSQVQKAASTYKKGLKVKADHYSGIQDIVGYLRNFRIDGQKLLADLQLLRTHPKRDYFLELAQEIDDNFGISISFMGKHESKDNVTYARCEKIYSADLVTEPAANHGLFETKQPKTVDTKENGMDIQELSKLLDEKLKPISDRIDNLEKKSEEVKVEAPKVEEAPKQEDFDAKVREAVANELKKAAVAPVPVAPTTEPVKSEKDEPKTFEQLFAEKVASGMTKSQAIRSLLGTKEHKEALERGISKL